MLVGNKFEVIMGYDNMVDNFNNLDLMIVVKWGSWINDEMNFGFFYWVFIDLDEKSVGWCVILFVCESCGVVDLGC